MKIENSHGFCPICGAPGLSQTYNYTTCERKHDFPSRLALKEPLPDGHDAQIHFTLKVRRSGAAPISLQMSCAISAREIEHTNLDEMQVASWVTTRFMPMIGQALQSVRMGRPALDGHER
jgi:hypothetical protein